VSQILAMVSLLVRDYDEAIAWYTGILGFELVEDTILSPEKRWVVIEPRGAAADSTLQGARLLLARAANPEQTARIGDQTGGRVFLFLWTDDFWRDFHSFQSRGVRFLNGPRSEPYGMVAVFEDLYGNKWDLVEKPARKRSPS